MKKIKYVISCFAISIISISAVGLYSVQGGVFSDETVDSMAEISSENTINAEEIILPDSMAEGFEDGQSSFEEQQNINGGLYDSQILEEESGLETAAGIENAVLLEPGRQYTVSLMDNYFQWFTYTPSETGTYMISSSWNHSHDTWVYLYSKENTQNSIESANQYDDPQFRLAYELQRGKTYYYQVFGGLEDTFLVEFKKVPSLESMEIVKTPNKTKFWYRFEASHFRVISMAGMQVQVNYGDGTSDIVSFDNQIHGAGIGMMPVYDSFGNKFDYSITSNEVDITLRPMPVGQYAIEVICRNRKSKNSIPMQVKGLDGLPVIEGPVQGEQVVSQVVDSEGKIFTKFIPKKSGKYSISLSDGKSVRSISVYDDNLRYLVTEGEYHQLVSGKTYYLYENGVGMEAVDGSIQVITKFIAEVKPSTPKLKGVAVTNTAITISWDKAKNADGYCVYRKTGTGGWKLIKRTGNVVQYTDNSVQVGYSYTYTVKAYRKEGNTNIYGGYDKKGKSAKLNTSIGGSSPKAKTAVITWKKTTGAGGYYVYRATNKNGKFTRIKTISNSNILKYTDSKLKSGSTYYYRVFPYGIVNGKKIAGSSSSIKGIKIK